MTTLSSEQMPTAYTEDNHTASGGRLWWTAIILFLLHRSLVTFAAMETANRLHEHWTWYRILVQGFRHWDAGWYIEIAKYGYFKLSETAFFPLYPLLLRFFHELTHFPYPLAGTLISSLFFFLSLYLLGQLAIQVDGYGFALISMSLLAFFPMSFFFDSMYAEALFLFLILMSTYLSLKGRFWLAGICAFLATLTRNTGVFVDVILFFDYLQLRGMGLHFWHKQWWGKLKWDILALLLAPLGIGVYALWSKINMGKALAFVAAERLWGRHYLAPWWSWFDTLKMLLSAHPISFRYYLLEFSSFTLVVITLILGIFLAKRSLNQFGWWLYTLMVTYIGSSEPSLQVKDYLLSFPRFILMLFPVFLYLGFVLRPRWIAIPVVVVFGWLLFKYTGVFTQGMWIA